LIAWGVPDLFADFAPRRFILLWRGSRDGFTAGTFHERCDGGSVFGGFTPLEWDSDGHSKKDDGFETFVFSLKNPHTVPARRFALKPEEKEMALSCDGGFGPCFGGVGERPVAND
jgi:hypothetical protein